MSDVREQILSRIFSILEGIKDFNAVIRNVDEFPEKGRPVASLIDGDEIKSDTSRAVWDQPYVMDMRPMIAIGVSSTPDGIGPDVNALRAKVLKTILTDSQLKGIIGRNGRIVYDGLSGKLSQGSLMACDMQLNFAISYPLIIQSL